MMPARETVAGDAFLSVSTSNMIFTLSVMGMRSPFASVRILLSSSTVLRSSIQIASTGPSAMIHMLNALLRLLYLPHMVANTPGTHSCEAGSTSPYISCARIALGLKRTLRCWMPSVLSSTTARCLKMIDLPPPVGPQSMMPWRTRVVSKSWITLPTHWPRVPSEPGGPS